MKVRAEDPVVSVLIPCRNERSTIERCLRSVVGNGYPIERLDVLIVDGMSEDGTRGLVRELVARFPSVRLIDNPRRVQQAGLNVGLERAKGSFVVRLDAHAALHEGYIGECVRYLQTTDAAAVGGRIETVPRVPSVIGRGIAAAMSESFGIGRSHFRAAPDGGESPPEWASTVPYGMYRRAVFETLGGYDEHLDASEDLDLHRRMAACGLKILFVPSLVSTYLSRSDLKSFWRHSVNNGRWAVLPQFHTGRRVVGLKHVIPLAFVTSLLAFGVGSIFLHAARWLLGAELALYLGASLVASVRAATRRRDPGLIVVLPLIFLTLHIGYGLGSLVGLLGGLRLVARRRPSEGALR